jgi:hypothetical protein
MKVAISENSRMGNQLTRGIWLQSNYSEEGLAKFGYLREEIRKESCYVLATCWNLMSKYDDFRNYFLEIR